MPLRVEKLILIYEGHKLDPLWIILDHNCTPPLLPLMFSTHLSRFGIAYETREISDESSRKKTISFKENEISDTTIRSYIYCLSAFLNYLQKCHEQEKTPNAHASSSCSSRFINYYLNQILANSLDSFQSLSTHRAALVAYYNFLDYLEISPRLELRIDRKTRQLMAKKSNKQHYIKYISRHERTKLLNTCETLAEKLMIRMGYEVGLRTSELTGLRVNGKNDLNSLFGLINNADLNHVTQFKYKLSGQYTKGSKTRWIYFDRMLLQDMKRYYDTERQWLIEQAGNNDSSFFLRTDQRFYGTGIKNEQGTRVFKKRAKAAGLNPLLSFHDLRHTFATELFNSELASADGRETRSESTALIVVAQRLGHSIGKDGHAPAVTTLYIRMRLQMLEMEEIANG